MDISIIVPVYNVEKYLIRCLNSICQQEFSGTFEVIAVDDASTDNSLQILLDYQKKECRLTVITHESNKKLSIARSTGIKVSKGDYIMHVDADDWLLPGALETLFSKCIQSKADVVVFNVMREDEKGNKFYLDRTGKELITTDKLKVQRYFFGGVVNKITQRKLIENGISGTVGVNSTEDLLYCFELLLKAKIIYMMPTTFYVYYINPESLTRTVQPDKYIQDQVVLINQIQLIDQKYNADSKLTENVLSYVEKWLFLMMARMQFGQKTKKEMNLQIISHFRNILILNPARIHRIESVMNNKYLGLIEVANRWSIRTALGIVYRSFRK
jgi:glycosyltransferase involved in cell wall biosynthesis